MGCFGHPPVNVEHSSCLMKRSNRRFRCSKLATFTFLQAQPSFSSYLCCSHWYIRFNEFYKNIKIYCLHKYISQGALVGLIILRKRLSSGKSTEKIVILNLPKNKNSITLDPKKKENPFVSYNFVWFLKIFPLHEHPHDVTTQQATKH